MTNSNAIPQLTEAQQQAFDASNGVVQGSSFVLMRPQVVLDLFGHTNEELQREL